MRIDLEWKNPELKLSDLKLGDVFQVKNTGISYYMVVQLFTPHVAEVKPSAGCVVLNLNINQVMKLASDIPVVLIPDAVVTNKGK